MWEDFIPKTEGEFTEIADCTVSFHGKEVFDEGKDLKDVLSGEVFLFAMQGFIFTGELLLRHNPNIKAKNYVEPAKQLYHKMLMMFEFEPSEEHYTYESIMNCLWDYPWKRLLLLLRW